MNMGTLVKRFIWRMENYGLCYIFSHGTYATSGKIYVYFSGCQLTIKWLHMSTTRQSYLTLQLAWCWGSKNSQYKHQDSFAWCHFWDENGCCIGCWFGCWCIYWRTLLHNVFNIQQTRYIDLFGFVCWFFNLRWWGAHSTYLACSSCYHNKKHHCQWYFICIGIVKLTVHCHVFW